MNHHMESGAMLDPTHPRGCPRDNREVSNLNQSQIAEAIGMNRSSPFRVPDACITLTARTALTLKRS